MAHPQVRIISHRFASRKSNPRVESLETRLLLSAARPAAMSVYHFGHPDSAKTVEVSSQSMHKRAATETISGEVTNYSNGKGVSRVKLQLIDASGTVVQTTRTNGKGFYHFNVSTIEPYTVHQVQSSRYTQVSTSFNSEAPVGGFALGFGANSYSYATGNSDPTKGPVGPPFWSSITTNGTAPFQSPINITVPPTDLSPYLSVNYASATPSKIMNNGHQIQVQFPTTSTTDTITLGGVNYTLSQFHYHDSSENTVNGQGFSMEEHFVNVSASGAATVLAVFLQLGAHNNALDPILNAATSSLTKAGSSTTIASPIDFAGLLPSCRQGWFYQGSLTTPPLSVGLNWLVFSTPITLDYAQLLQYEAVAAGAGFLPNNRPIQPTDGRQVNQFNQDVNFQGASVAGVNFAVAPTVKAKSPATSRSATPAIVTAQAVGVNGNAQLAELAAGTLPTPVSGCNCALCQALRNGTFHLVNPATLTPNAVASNV